jgi:NAD-dependent aldehyde dehydrogenases
MSIGHDEIFGPVLCIKRVKDFEEGLAIMNASPFANGSVIYTQNGYYAREFSREPMQEWWALMWVSLFLWGFLDSPATKIPFSVIFTSWGWMGSVSYGAENVTATWFRRYGSCGKVDTWDGTISSMPENTK